MTASLSAVTRLRRTIANALVDVAEVLESDRLYIGPLVISSRNAAGRLIREAFELGRDAGPRAQEREPQGKRHLSVVS